MLLAAQSATKRRRAIVVRLVLPLAAVLAVGTAWAAWTGRLSPEPQSERPAPTATTMGTAPRATLTLPPPAIPSATSTPTSVPDAPDGGAARAASAAAAPSSSGAPAASAKPSPSTARPPADDPEETRYRAAHEAHFVKQDPARALAKWDAYLAAHPSGRFAPEARYNRGICLIRLGRTKEARDALRPFADTRPGSYRQSEAKQLLDALE